MFTIEQVLILLIAVDKHVQDSEGVCLNTCLTESWDGVCHSPSEVLNKFLVDFGLPGLNSWLGEDESWEVHRCGG